MLNNHKNELAKFNDQLDQNKKVHQKEMYRLQIEEKKNKEEHLKIMEEES